MKTFLPRSTFCALFGWFASPPGRSNPMWQVFCPADVLGSRNQQLKFLGIAGTLTAACCHNCVAFSSRTLTGSPRAVVWIFPSRRWAAISGQKSWYTPGNAGLFKQCIQGTIDGKRKRPDSLYSPVVVSSVGASFEEWCTIPPKPVGCSYDWQSPGTSGRPF